MGRLPVVLQDEGVVGVELAEGALQYRDMVVDCLEVRLEDLPVLAHEVAQLALVHVRALHVLNMCCMVSRVVATHLAPVMDGVNLSIIRQILDVSCRNG